MRHSPYAVLSLALSLIACGAEDDAPNDALARHVESIKAIDVHAHPLRVVVAGAKPDSEYDALPLDGIPPFPVPSGLDTKNPAFRDAQRALYGLTSTDTGAAYKSALTDARNKVMQREGEKFPAWALDQAKIDVMLANRIVMGAGLTTGRFRWVPFADALMLPLDNSGEAARTPDTRALYPLETKLLRRYLGDLALKTVPATLAEYERAVLSATLARQKAGGAVGIKFEAAYLRTLDFEPADPAAAAAIYARYANHGTPTRPEYRTLQDHLFRAICREAGKLGLTVQIHSLDGFGGYYSPSGAAPGMLESAFSDSTLARTKFVIVHGGWPRIEETNGLLSRANVYADISMMTLIGDPEGVVRALRLWLTEWPDKVLFGTDAFDGGAEEGWDQIAWVSSRNARRALTEALTGMVRDGVVSEARAKDIATMVLRGNASAAYPSLDPTRR